MTSSLAILTAAALAAVPLAADAVSVAQSYDLHTRIVEQAPAVGEFDGSLQLHVSAGGYVSGYYRPEYNARFIPITGGVTDGTHVWLDIGAFAVHPLRFTGTLVNGKLTATAYGPIVDNGEITGLTLVGTAGGN